MAGERWRGRLAGRSEPGDVHLGHLHQVERVGRGRDQVDDGLHDGGLHRAEGARVEGLWREGKTRRIKETGKSWRWKWKTGMKMKMKVKMKVKFFFFQDLKKK